MQQGLGSSHVISGGMLYGTRRPVRDPNSAPEFWLRGFDDEYLVSAFWTAANDAAVMGGQMTRLSAELKRRFCALDLDPEPLYGLLVACGGDKWTELAADTAAFAHPSPAWFEDLIRGISVAVYARSPAARFPEKLADVFGVSLDQSDLRQFCRQLAKAADTFEWAVKLLGSADSEWSLESMSDHTLAFLPSVRLTAKALAVICEDLSDVILPQLDTNLLASQKIPQRGSFSGVEWRKACEHLIKCAHAGSNVTNTYLRKSLTYGLYPELF
jgi:hypothetical protein